MARIFCVVDVRYQPLAIILARQKHKEVFLYHLNLKFQIGITRHLGLFKKKAPGLTTGRCHEGHVS